jgi:ferredoxin
MIIGDRKPLAEIQSMIEGLSKVLVVGCRGCVTVCNVGGTKEAGILASTLRIAARRDGRDVQIDEYTLERQCDPEYVEELSDVIEDYDGAVSIACGVGPQFLSERYPEKPIFPGINTTFIGGALEHGVWAERCQACGNCLLDVTGGLCPVARCSKSLMNGPCGGSSGGKCEISPDVDCIWDMIVRKFMDQGKADQLERLMPLKNWSTSRDGGPRIRIKEDLRK